MPPKVYVTRLTRRFGSRRSAASTVRMGHVVPRDPRIDAPAACIFIAPASASRPCPTKGRGHGSLPTRLAEHHVRLVGERLERPETVRRCARSDASRSRSKESRIGPPSDHSFDGWSASLHRGTHASRRHRSRLQDRGRGGRWTNASPTRRVWAEFVERVGTFVREDRLDETFVDIVCDPPRVFTYGGMIAHRADLRRAPAYARLSAPSWTRRVTDLGAGDPMHWEADAS